MRRTATNFSSIIAFIFFSLFVYFLFLQIYDLVADSTERTLSISSYGRNERSILSFFPMEYRSKVFDANSRGGIKYEFGLIF